MKNGVCKMVSEKAGRAGGVGPRTGVEMFVAKAGKQTRASY